MEGDLFDQLLNGKASFPLLKGKSGGHSIEIEPLNADGKSYQCKEEGCGKFFSSLSNLTRHQLIHSGERPYACEHCEKRFNQQGNLRKHLKSHENAHLRWNRNTTDKPFKCSHPGCHRSFTVKSSLQNHMISHQEMAVGPTTDQVKKEPSYSAILDPYDDAPKQIASSSVIKSRCLHSGCPLTFNSQRDLRSHLFSHAPGLAAEYKAMTGTMLNLIQMVESWDIKTPKEKELSLQYVETVKDVLTHYPLLSEGPKVLDPKDVVLTQTLPKNFNDFNTAIIHNDGTYHQPAGSYMNDDLSVITSSAASTEDPSNYHILENMNSPRTTIPASPNSYGYPNHDMNQRNMNYAENTDEVSDFLQSLDNGNEEFNIMGIIDQDDTLLSALPTEKNNASADMQFFDDIIPVCRDCKSTPYQNTTQQSHAMPNQGMDYGVLPLNNGYTAEEVNRYGYIARSLAAPLMSAREEIMQGWQQHLLPIPAPAIVSSIPSVETREADNGRKRRLVS